jgi:hypothetical protein
MQYAYPFKHKRKEKVENYVSFLIVLPFDYYFLQWSNFVIIVQYVRNKKAKAVPLHATRALVGGEEV